MQGTIVHWNAVRGFGFIRPDDGSRDVFTHVAQLPPGMAPDKGARVRYGVQRDGLGVRAIDVIAEDAPC